MRCFFIIWWIRFFIPIWKHNCIDWFRRSTQILPKYHQLTNNLNSNSSFNLFLKFILHHHNLNSLPSLPIKLKDGVNFQNMFPANSSYTFQRFYSQHKEAKLRLSEFIRNFINSRRCFCSETNHSFTAKVHQQTGLRISDFDKNS